jgi:hypothetical protein
MPNPAPPSESAVFQRFCDAAGDMLQAGLEFARQDDPHWFTALNGALQAGAKVSLTVELGPPTVVFFRLRGIINGNVEEVEVFRYVTRLARPAEIN